MEKIYFLFPIHNESERVLRVKLFLDWVTTEFKEHDYIFTFVLNNCFDDTEKKIKENFSGYPLEIIKSDKKNRGSGLNKFYKLNKSGYYAICSIDNAWSFDFYKQAFNLLKNKKYEIIYGPKSHANSVIKTNFVRKTISYFSKIYIKILFGSLIDQDTQCIKFFNSNIKFLKDLNDYNYFAETEFYLLSKISKNITYNLPVTVKNDNKNSKVNFRSIYSYMCECINFRFNYFNKIK